MYHGQVSKEIAKGLKELRKRIDRADIPSSSLDESINLATWNIREFGRKPREEAAIHYIAEIMNQFDLIAVVELRDDLSDLKRVLKILGPYWKAVFSDYVRDPGGNRERVAYVYDKRAVAFTGLAAEADAKRVKDPETGEYLPEESWWRKPFMASFRAGSFDFIAVAAHIRWGDRQAARIPPLKLMAEWVFQRANEKHVVDKDFIVVGDFNIPGTDDDLFEAITSKGLQIPEGLRDVYGTNLAQVKHYDHILHFPRFTKCFSNHGGVLDFYMNDQQALFPGMSLRDFTFQLSDHLPLWIQVKTELTDERLDQILNQ
jgi:endonuclease/exonuclease/phosphatase family metal-dependent hydrolase